MQTLKHLLKTILKYRLSSGLTILSLVVAFLGIIILTLYISYERSFDNFHNDGKDIYHMSFNVDGDNVPAPMEALIKENISEINKSVIFSKWWDNLLYKPGQTKKEAIRADMLAASKDFFTVFNFPLLYGDSEKVLSKPNVLVVSESLAKDLFGTTDVVGKSLIVRGKKPFTISGVMKDMPKNTSFYQDAFVSFATYRQPNNDFRGAQDWSEWSFTLFLKLQKGVDKTIVESKIAALKRINESIDAISKRYSKKINIILTPIDQIHYKRSNLYYSSVNKKVLNILSLLVFILAIMGAVNFINFSTSQAPLRAKSLAMRQILGERKWKAKILIISEAVLLSLLALIIALVIHYFTYQKIEDTFKISGLSFTERPIILLSFVVFATIFGIIAGWYPSRYITSPPPAQAVKGKMYFSAKGKRIRNILITTQFVFTITLIISALTIEKQLNYWNNYDMGIDKDNVLYLNTTKALRDSYQAFANELLKNPEIIDYTYSQSLPGSVGMGWGRSIEGQQVQIQAWPIDDRFLDFFDIKIADGRHFMKGDSDINNFILNEKAVQQFGWEKPLERKFPGFDFEGDIVGIAKNFNFSSLQYDITPMLFWLTNERKYNLMLKVKTENYTQLMSSITALAQQFDPESTFTVHFLDDYLERLYSKETRMARFIEFGSLWAILLSLTGLLGLIIFISRDRIKEIGIRKVNGANISEIIFMLNRSVATWLFIAFVVATPVAYYIMNKWLENFAYKTTLSWWIFALAGVLALGIALLTVSWQSWRAATRNPVEALRYE